MAPAAATQGVAVDLGYNGANNNTTRWAATGGRSMVTVGLESWVVQPDGSSTEIAHDDLWSFRSKYAQWNSASDAAAVHGMTDVTTSQLYTVRDGSRELLTDQVAIGSGHVWVGNEHVVHRNLVGDIGITALPTATGSPPAAAQALLDLEAHFQAESPCGWAGYIVLMQIDPLQGYALDTCGGTAMVCTLPALDGQTCVEAREPVGTIYAAQNPSWELRLDTLYTQ